MNAHCGNLLFDVSGPWLKSRRSRALIPLAAAIKTALEVRGQVWSVEQVTRPKTIY